MDGTARAHGLYKTVPLTFRIEGRSLITKDMDILRTNPLTQLAGSGVAQVTGMNDGLDMIDAKGEGYHIPPTNGILIFTGANDHVIARSSGTGSKLKCYLEVVLSVALAATPHVAVAERLD